MENSRNPIFTLRATQSLSFFSILVQDCSTAMRCQWVISLMAPLMKYKTQQYIPDVCNMVKPRTKTKLVDDSPSSTSPRVTKYLHTKHPPAIICCRRLVCRKLILSMVTVGISSPTAQLIFMRNEHVSNLSKANELRDCSREVSLFSNTFHLNRIS